MSRTWRSFGRTAWGSRPSRAAARCSPGLNAFEPGQEHAAHTHAGQDKLYVVMRGSAEVQIGGVTEQLAAGDAAFAPAGVSHSIRNIGSDRMVVMAVLAPPPSK